MKKIHFALIAVVAMAAIAAIGISAVAAPFSKNSSPTVVASTMVVKLDAKSTVIIMGSGYQAGQEVRLLLQDKNGTKSDIGSSLDPEPVANERGAWGTVWTVGLYSHKDIAAPGMYAILATDSEYNILASTPFGFYDAKKPRAEWPSWAKAAVAP